MKLKLLVLSALLSQPIYADDRKQPESATDSMKPNISEVSGVKVESLVTSHASMKNFSGPNMPLIGVVQELEKNTTSVVIHQLGTDSQNVIVEDTDGDGIYDILFYYALDASGNIVTAVEDYGMDGQADYKINFKKKTAQVYFEGHWLHVVNFGSQQSYIETDKKHIPLQTILKQLGRPF